MEETAVSDVWLSRESGGTERRTQAIIERPSELEARDKLDSQQIWVTTLILDNNGENLIKKQHRNE